MKTIISFTVISAWIMLIVSMIVVGANSGPNCAGKDPRWIGWCNEAPTHRENNNG